MSTARLYFIYFFSLISLIVLFSIFLDASVLMSVVV